MSNNRKPKKWFGANVLFQFAEGGKKRRQAYEEIVFLVSADGERNAKRKALRIAKEQQKTYLDENGNTVRYTLVRLLDLAELLDSQFRDGTEVYWRVHLKSTENALVKRLGYASASQP